MSYVPGRTDILRLDPPEAEHLLQVILWSCADRMGASREVVDTIDSSTVSRRPRQNVKDGGLELTVRLPASAILQNPFVHHSMIVQVKSGKTQLTATAIEEEVEKEKVKTFLANGGHYVIAYTGIVPTYGEHDTKWEDEQINELRNALKKHFPSGNVTGAIWTADDVERLTKDAPQAWDVFASGNIFATLSSQTLKNLIDKRTMTDFGFDIPFVQGGQREGQLEELKSWMQTFSGYFELRGNMGVGKSRLAYEAVVSTGRDGTTIWHLSRPDNSFITACQAYLSSQPSAFLRMVVDECDDDMADKLRNLAQVNRDRVALLAIIPFKSRDATTKQADDIHIVNKMTKDDLTNLLGSFQLKDDVVTWIVQICDGYPKLARVLAERAKLETEEMSKEQLIAWLTEHREFKDKTIATRGWVNLILSEKDQEVLRVLALLTEIGFQGKRKDEYQKLCDFFGLNADTVEEAIKKNLAKGLLAKGSDYIYVTPLILASYLCADRLSTMRPDKFEALGKLLHQLPRPHFTGSPLESLSERIKMSALNDEVQTSLLKALETFRPFDKAILQSEVVAELAFACSHFQPHNFLKTFVADLRNRDPQEVKTWLEGRRKTVRFLEAAAFYPELFDDAIEGLFLLSKAENETWANNASGVWVEFFSAALSGSMAPLASRINWLTNLIESGDGAHELIQKAVETVVSPNHSRMAGHENQLGLPKIEVKHGFKFSELYDSLNRLIETIKNSDYQINALAKVFIDNLRGLVRLGYVQKNLAFVEWLQELSANDIALQQRLLIASQHILEWESKLLTAEAKVLFEDIQKHLTSGTLENRVRRWSFEPLLKDYELEKESNSPLDLLIGDLIKTPKSLEKLGPILTSPSAVRSGYFAFKLGQLDKTRACWTAFDGWTDRKRALDFKIRYLVGRAHGQENPDWVDDRLDELAGTDAPNVLADASKDVETERSLKRLLVLAQTTPEYIRLLVFGGRASRLSGRQLNEVVDFFRTYKSEVNLCPLWDVLGQYTHGNKDKPLPLGETQIRYLISSLYSPAVGTMTDYYQDETIVVLMAHHMNETVASDLATECLNVIVNEKSDYHRSKRSGEILKSIAEKWGDSVFKVIFERLSSDDGLALFKMEQVLDDWAHGIFSDILEKMSETCDEKTAELIIRLMPNSYGALNKTSANLLKRFSSNSKIESAVARSFYSGVFSGPVSDRLASQIEALESWAQENGINKLGSVLRLRDSLSHQLEGERKLEEEEEFLNKKGR
ncbi:MAG: hypothetical protein JST16_09820 [Bdellovibrionales bacterium]|nr:hypothetical protein [Bdellovibrionales bacterium]